MTAAAIRKWAEEAQQKCSVLHTADIGLANAVLFSALASAEIAAQLADLNEHFRQVDSAVFNEPPW